MGDAYTAPSSLIDLMTCSEPVTSGIDRDRPLCEASPWYIGQFGVVPAVSFADVEVCGDGVTLEAADVEGVEGDARVAGAAQPAAASASRTTSAPARTPPATPRARCPTPLL